MGEQPLTRPTILIVDDVVENIHILGAGLAGDYDVRFATSGEEALGIAMSDGPVDLLLLDVVMPGLDGYAVCRRLKADDRTRDIPVIFITTRDNEQDETRGLDLGAIDYIKKPFSLAVVKARVKAHLGSESAKTQHKNTVVAGHYEVIELVAEGGMGAIYKARQPHLDRWVALKVLRKGLALDEASVARFHREARIISQISHPNIITLFDYGVEPNGRIYLVTEWLDGEDVSTVLRRDGRLAPERAARIAMLTGYSLSAVHLKGIVHRDLKPANIFLVSDDGHDGYERVKVIDFGVAKNFSEPDVAPVTHHSGTCGTPAFMSPEQTRGEKLDVRSDVYSLGCVLFTMLVGNPPFLGNHFTQMTRHQEEPLPFLPATLPSRLNQIIQRATRKHRDERYPSAQRMANELKGFLELAGKSTGSPGVGPGPTTSHEPASETGPTFAALTSVRSSAQAAAGGSSTCGPIAYDQLVDYGRALNHLASHRDSTAAQWRLLLEALQTHMEDRRRRSPGMSRAEFQISGPDADNAEQGAKRGYLDLDALELPSERSEGRYRVTLRVFKSGDMKLRYEYTCSNPQPGMLSILATIELAPLCSFQAAQSEQAFCIGSQLPADILDSLLAGDPSALGGVAEQIAQMFTAVEQALERSGKVAT